MTEENVICECGMPITKDEACSCEPSLCYHCCKCEADCECGCKKKEEKE